MAPVPNTISARAGTNPSGYRMSIQRCKLLSEQPGARLHALAQKATTPEAKMAMSQLGVPDLPTVQSASQAVGEAAQAVNNLRPSAKIANAIEGFKELEGFIGEHTVPITDDIGKALADMKEGIDTGLNAPSVVNKFVSRIADTDQPPLTYAEARKFYSNMGDLATSEKMAANSKMQGLIYRLQGALGDAISGTADQAGKLQQFQEAMKGFASGSKAAERFDILKNALIKAGIGAAGVGAAATLYKELK